MFLKSFALALSLITAAECWPAAGEGKRGRRSCDNSTTPTSYSDLSSRLAQSVRPPLEGSAGRAGGSNPRTFEVLELNLCNSGVAGCYQGGRSVPEAQDLIRERVPDVVTLNEICSRNVVDGPLQESLRELWPRDYVYAVFMPAMNRRTGEPIKCNTGDSYGSAVMGRIPAQGYHGIEAYGGIYTNQTATAGELRTFACVEANGDHFACVTHLTHQGQPIALAQCQALMYDALPHLQECARVKGQTVVGADLNLRYNGSSPTNVQKCVPGGYSRVDDGDVLNVIWSNDFDHTDFTITQMTFTDHPALNVELQRGLSWMRGGWSDDD